MTYINLLISYFDAKIYVITLITSKESGTINHTFVELKSRSVISSL